VSKNARAEARRERELVGRDALHQSRMVGISRFDCDSLNQINGFCALKRHPKSD
jgi:hypothetical protein